MIRCPQCNNFNPEGSSFCTLCQFDLTNYEAPAEEYVSPEAPAAAVEATIGSVSQRSDDVVVAAMDPLDPGAEWPEEDLPANDHQSFSKKPAGFPDRVSEKTETETSKPEPFQAHLQTAEGVGIPAAAKIPEWNAAVDHVPAGMPVEPGLQKSARSVRVIPASHTPQSRPKGAVFANQFIALELMRTEGKGVFYYHVREILSENQPAWLQCQNCGAVQFYERSRDMTCQTCRAVLEREIFPLELRESTAPFAEVLTTVVEKNLTHSNLRPPLAVFKENLAGLNRYCQVSVFVRPVPAELDRAAAYHGFVGLAHAVDVLAEKGLTFKGRINPSLLGYDHNHLVFSRFDEVFLSPADFREQFRQEDLKALIRLLKEYLKKGKADLSQINALDDLLAYANGPQGIRTGRELAAAIERILKEVNQNTRFDYRMGKATHAGMRRKLNEDSLYTFESSPVIQSRPHPLGIYLVADGMGGHSNGEVASGTIVDYFSQHAPARLTEKLPDGKSQNWEEWLQTAVQGANYEVYRMRQQAGTDMGSTLVLILLDGLNAYIAHVGDSRAYLINHQEIQRITADHSLVERLVACGQILRQEVRTHPQRNVIYRTIGDKDQVDAELNQIDLDPGNKLLLCSDGLWEMLDEADIFKIVQEAEHPQAACDQLINAANQAGGEDNITVVLVEVSVI